MRRIILIGILSAGGLVVMVAKAERITPRRPVAPTQASSAKRPGPAAPTAPPAMPTSSVPPAIKAIPSETFCATAGKVSTLAPTRLEVDMGGMRGIVAGDKSSTAQLTFTYQGPSKTESPLANGEVRRQIGLKLRAVNTCNLVYVMWHVEPTPGVYVSVKSNPGKSTHAQCGANGYINLRPTGGTQPPQVTAGVKHVLRATLDGRTLRAYADEKLAWEGTLPDVADTLSGPAGVRSDNGKFDFEVALPGGAKAGTPCPPADGGD